jgi:branched-chain amino acid transport system substrate-binding protein
MMHNKNFIRNIILSFITLLIINHPVVAQQNHDIDNQFNLAVSYYQTGNYQDALPIFDKIAIHLPYNEKTTAAYLFLGKTYLQMNDLFSAKQFLQDFLNKYPSSVYDDEAHLSLIKVYYEQEDYKKAFEGILNLITNADSVGYSKYATSLGEKLATNYLNLKDLNNYYDSVSDSSLKPYLLFLIGKRAQAGGNYNLALKTFRNLSETYPGSKEAVESDKLINSLEEKQNAAESQNLLAVLLPLTNDQTGAKIPAANEILEGIKYGVAEYNLNHNKEIGLIIRDTGNDSLKIAVIKDEIGTVPSIKAIIGPIFSNEVRYTLKAFNNSGIPVISPTATDNDLVHLSDYFFQANPSFSMRGKVMAQYIYYVTGKKNIGVLNARQGYSPILSDAFIKEFDKIGGSIIVTSSYNSGSFELNGPVSTVAADSDKLEGIYLPLSDKNDAAPLLSQMVQQQIKAPIFGNQDWFYAKGFETSSELSSQLSFTSDFFIDYNDTTFDSFSKDFLEQTGIDINRNVLYGYDTANYLLTLINAGADSRVSLINTMESGIEVKGYHNNIAFGKEHVNRFLNIVRYIDGKFELVDRFKSGE